MAKIDMPTSSLNQIPGQQPKKKLEKVTTGKVTVRQQTDMCLMDMMSFSIRTNPLARPR